MNGHYGFRCRVERGKQTITLRCELDDWTRLCSLGNSELDTKTPDGYHLRVELETSRNCPRTRVVLGLVFVVGFLTRPRRALCSDHTQVRT
jgi:hypothetical protein